MMNWRFLIDFEGWNGEPLLRQGFVVPKGVAHPTRAPERTIVLIVEAASIIPTGNAMCREGVAEPIT